MNDSSISNFHVSYVDVTQHWNPNSANYAGADALVTLLFDGWLPQPTVYLEQKWYAGLRHVKIYHIELRRGEERLVMPVILNPYVNRLIRNYDLRVVPLEEKEAQPESSGKKAD